MTGTMAITGAIRKLHVQICSVRRYINMHSMILRVLASWLVLLAVLLVPATASAHPLGNFTINHYSRLEPAPGEMHIFYVLDMAEIPAFQTLQKIDADGDGKMSASETERFSTERTQALVQNLTLSIEGKPVQMQVISPTLAFPAGQGKLNLLRLSFWLMAPLPQVSADSIAIEYKDNNDPDRLGWREIVTREQNGVNILDSNVSDKDVSNELRQYPQNMLSAPLRQLSAKFRISGTLTPPQQNPATANTATTSAFGSAKTDAEFAELITLHELSPSVIIIALLTAVALGALHALEPGHGKTMAAAYLVGTRATPRHAIGLGLTITTMHTSSVFIMGLVTLFASQFILPEKLFPWLGLTSALIIIVMGIRMFLSRLRNPSSQDHSHEGAGAHSHDDAAGHSHSHLPSEGKSGWRGILTVGIAGGLVPCPAALIVLLSALGLGRLGFGMMLIVAFSVGLALVLSLIGITVLYGEKWLKRHQAENKLVQFAPSVMRFVQVLPAYSGLLVVGAGLLLLYHAWPFLRVWFQ